MLLSEESEEENAVYDDLIDSNETYARFLLLRTNQYSFVLSLSQFHIPQYTHIHTHTHTHTRFYESFEINSSEWIEGEFLEPLSRGANEHIIQNLPSRKYKQSDALKDTDKYFCLYCTISSPLHLYRESRDR
jgi:hypothetical protein